MRINLKIHTGTSKQKIQKIDDKHYEVWLKERPIKNKANVELLKFLKKYFHKPILIIKGSSSKKKVIELGDNL